MKDSAIIKFLWHHIKPYKWYYLVMVAAPIISSFYPFAYNYAIKLIIDAMADTTVNFDYKNILIENSVTVQPYRDFTQISQIYTDFL